jgi:hypothetical protein
MRMLITAWIAGEMFSLLIDQTHVPWDLLIPFGCCGLIVLAYQVSKDLYIKKISFYLLACICLVIAGFSWVEYLKTDMPQKFDTRLEGSPILLQGFIDELPKVSEKSIQFGFQVTYWETPYTNQNPIYDFPRRVFLLYSSKDHLLAFKPGQYLELKVKLKEIRMDLMSSSGCIFRTMMPKEVFKKGA